MGRVEGKVALISGGARNIGGASARLLVAEGAKVVIGDLLDDEGAALAEELGDAARYVHLDVTSDADWKSAVAFTVAEFLGQSQRPQFQGLLAAHLIEHLPAGEAAGVLAPYVPFLEPDAVVVLICPQERGFASDPTHTVFVDQPALAALAAELGLRTERQFSFPLPRRAGKLFTYNEFVTVARR